MSEQFKIDPRMLDPEFSKQGVAAPSPASDLAMLLMIAGAVKAAPALAGKAGGKLVNLLKKEVGDMTVSNAALKAGRIPELTKHGIKNWKDLRIHNAFLPRTPLTPGGTLQTLPTKPAWAALGGGAAGAGLLIKNKKKK